MLRLIATRLLQLPLIVGAVLAITLTLAWVVPGNPLERPVGRRPSAEVIKAMKAQYKLDDFAGFAGSYVFNASGLKYLFETVSPEARARREAMVAAGRAMPPRPVFDLGPSLQHTDQRVSSIIGDSLPVSMTLGAAAVMLALVIGLSAGIIGALRPGSAADHGSFALALVGISVPNFVIGTVFLVVFAVWLRWLPAAGWMGPSYMILPALTLSLPPAAYIARLTRMGMIEVLASDYVRTARAKGASMPRVVIGHALRNAFLPVLSYLGPAAALAMTGSFVVEKVFSIPGMGQHFVDAVLNKDLFLILGVVLVYATLLIVFNLVVDVMYRWVDPRIA